MAFRPLYIATALLGATAAIVLVARHRPPPPSPSFVRSIERMGFQSVSEFDEWARMIDAPEKRSFSSSEVSLLKTLLGRRNESSWDAVYLIGISGDDSDRHALLPDLRSFARGREGDQRLTAMMECWKAEDAGPLVTEIAQRPSDPLYEAARGVVRDSAVPGRR